MVSRGTVVGRFRGTLVAGFALLIVLVVLSAYIGIRAMQSFESGASSLADQRGATMRLIDEVQREEDSLSGIFYALATGRNLARRNQLLERLDDLEGRIRRTTALGAASSDAREWDDIRSIALDFIAEVRGNLQSGGEPTDAFFGTHEKLTDALANLSRLSLEEMSASERREADRIQDRINFSLLLLGTAFLIALGGAMVAIYFLDQSFRRLRWQASELDLLSSRSMHIQEETAKRLSRELHDHFGQTLGAIEANLVFMKRVRSFNEARVEDCLALVKDAIENVREASQLLRPSILDDFGLAAALEYLASSFSERTGIEVKCLADDPLRLGEEAEVQLFRIAQEALTNIGRHSRATSAVLELSRTPAGLQLHIRDNGTGLSTTLRSNGLGLAGMRARARTIGATFELRSPPGEGVEISVTLPKAAIENATQDTITIR